MTDFIMLSGIGIAILMVIKLVQHSNQAIPYQPHKKRRQRNKRRRHK